MSVRVLVVDDSGLARRMIRAELSRHPEIEVVGVAKDPLDASEQIEALLPDVITLDMELPGMNGLTFLQRLMHHHPMPVVIVSAYTPRGSRLAMQALECGAVDIIPKPGGELSVGEMGAALVASVLSAATMRIGPGRAPARAGERGAAGRANGGNGAASRRALPEPLPPQGVLPPLGRPVPAGRVIAIGSSTGGTTALRYLLSRLPPDMPPLLIVQHMPRGFTLAFAQSLDGLSALAVKEALDGDDVLPGHVYIAPGGRHMMLRRVGPRYRIEVVDGPRVHRQRPSVEVLFQSVTKVAGRAAIGAILTGMGADGATGLLAMRQAGAETIAQDEASCVVFGMPKAALDAGGVKRMAHLHDIPTLLRELV